MKFDVHLYTKKRIVIVQIYKNMTVFLTFDGACGIIL